VSWRSSRGPLGLGAPGKSDGKGNGDTGPGGEGGAGGGPGGHYSKA
jgi:hypothetical protein